MNSLVLSGGGSKGSYEVGVLKYCAEHGIYPEGFNMISGTSVGAINALAFGMFPPEKFGEAVAYVEKMWRGIRGNKDIWKNRFPPYFSAFWKPSLRKTGPLRKYLEAAVDVEAIPRSGVHLRLPAVDLYTGQLQEFDEHCEDPIAAAMASGSFPVFFPPEEIGDGFYTDGGVRDIAPLGSAIRAGTKRVLVVLCSDPFHMSVKTKKDLNWIVPVLGRVIDVMTKEILLNDIKMCRLINEVVAATSSLNRARRGAGEAELELLKGRRVVDLDVIYPTIGLSASLEFDPPELARQIEIGYSDAEAYFNKKKES